MKINIQTQRETDGDCYLWEAQATRGDLTGHGNGYSEASAIVRAKLSLEKLEKQSVLLNWENSPESKLAEISILEFCLADYSPSLAELSAQF